MSGERYPMPAARHRIEQVIERSRFICTLVPARTAAEAQAFVKEMNAEFPDATHNCWAYVVGPPGSTGQVGMSDDGEPHGTAGRPMLTVLLHSGVGDVAAVVTRYYGGTKLGTGGLVKAYGGAVQEALATLPRVERVEFATVTIDVAYPAVSALQQLWPVHEVQVVGEDYGASARFTVRVPEGNLAALRAAVMDATRGQAGFATGE
ncbi:MAG TPA: YigZ family protein [Gemmatimonadaceae bacterium]|jgi:uncharacterized YigZ family protein